MISKMKLQNGILTLIGFIILVSICILVDRLESRKPEMEIRESVEGVNVYNEESKLVDLLQFIYRTNKHYILTYIIQSFGTKIDIFEYYRKKLEKIGWEFTGEADNIDHSNNRKIGESFNFRKGKYRLGIYFSTRDLHNYEKSNGQDPLRYSVTIYPQT